MSRRFLASILLTLSLASCSRRPSDKAFDTPADSSPEEPPSASEVRYPEGMTAEAVFLAGGAEILRGEEGSGALLAPTPGTRLALGDRVRTGADGTVEIRLGDLASLRLLPSSVAVLRDASLVEGAAHAEVFLESGTALFAVRPLEPRESFIASTERLLSGVRGTRFLVTSARDASVVAVREGRVAALPSGPALDRIVQSARTNAVARAALRAMIAMAPEAGPDREIRVDAAAQSRAEGAYARLEALLETLPALPAEDSAARERLFAADDPPAPPEPDAEARRSFGLAREAAGAVRPYLALPVNAGPESLRAFERFRDFRSDPQPPAVPGSSPGIVAPHPALLGRTNLSPRPLSGSLVRVPDTGTLLAVDLGGTLRAFDAQGRVLWSLETGDRAGNLRWPVTYKGVAYYSGESGLVAVDGRDGTVLARRPLDPARDLALRPAPFPDSLLLPTQEGFDLVDPSTLKTTTAVAVPGGTGSLPTQRDSFALIVNKDGTLLLMDPMEGTVRAQTPTGARGSTSVSPRIFENRACFADRSGLVVMVDLERMEVLWERRTGVEILTDLEIAREGVLAYGNGTLLGFRLDGESLMSPIQGVSAPPLLSRGTVFYGTSDGDLVVAQASPWKVRGKVPLGDVPSVRPLQVGNTLYVGTRGGSLVRIDTAKLP